MRLRGITVLLVEDDLDNLELMASYFDGEGARTLSANSVVAALAMTAVVRVDVIVSDLELLDGDGCALVSELRQREGMQHVPAIAITGYSQQKWRDKALNGGFTRYAVKPFSLDTLVAWMAELTGPAASGVRGEPSTAAETTRAGRDRLSQ
jgi:two-component system CheB/CheR fusion protein